MKKKNDLTRAELVRQRQEKEITRRLEKTTKRAYKPAPTVPARNRGQAAGNRKRTPNQRLFNVALGVPDMRVQRPTFHLPELRTGRRTASLILTCVLCAAIYLAWTLPYFRATWATVIGNNRVTADEINAGLGLAGQPIFTIQPDEVERRLRLNLHELSSVEVNVFLPNHVYVNVTEREPVIVWQQGEGYTWVDAEGVAFRPRGYETQLVPVIGNGTPPTGIAPADDPLSPPPYISRETVDAILALAPSLPTGVSMIYDPRHGLGWNDSRGWQAFFGTGAEDMPLKARVYQSLVDSLVARGVYPEFISVEYVDAPYYRTVQKSRTGDNGE